MIALVNKISIRFKLTMCKSFQNSPEPNLKVRKNYLYLGGSISRGFLLVLVFLGLLALCKVARQNWSEQLSYHPSQNEV